MINILYTYNTQIHKKATIFLINLDTFLYNWVFQIESRPTRLLICCGSLNIHPWETIFSRLSWWIILRSPFITCPDGLQLKGEWEHYILCGFATIPYGQSSVMPFCNWRLWVQLYWCNCEMKLAQFDSENTYGTCRVTSWCYHMLIRWWHTLNDIIRIMCPS
jgi:hypothetical protein